jgi:hypothetical protein
MAQYEDDYTEGAQVQFKTLAAQRQQALAYAMRAQAEGETALLGEYAQEIADLDAKVINLAHLYERHVAQNAPRPVAPPNPDAWRDKKSDEMTHEDVRQMLNETSATAKLGGGITYEENVNQMRKLAQAKAAGDYHGKP